MKHKKRNKHMKRFRVEVRATLLIDLDERLTPDDEWRSQFYNIHDLKGVAEHIAYNITANGVKTLAILDGFADRPETMLDIHSVDWDCEDVEALDGK